MSSTENNECTRSTFRTCSFNSYWYDRYLRQFRYISLLTFFLFLFLLAPPNGQPTLLVPNIPLKQGQSANITCLSSPSKPASKLVFYKNDQAMGPQSSLRISYEVDMKTKKNMTKLVYTIDDPDSTWDNARVRCEQIYQYVDNYRKEVSAKLQVFCMFFIFEI